MVTIEADPPAFSGSPKCGRTSVGISAKALQFFKGDWPVEPQPYLIIYSIILIPNAAFAIGVFVAQNVLLRDKYLCYAVSLALAGGLYYATASGTTTG